MMNSYTVNIDGIGPVLFEKSRRAKRLIISARTLKGIRVAIPSRVSFKSALEFVNLKKPWIREQLIRIKQMGSQRQAANSLIVFDKEKAKKKLTDRLNYLAEKHGFTYYKVTIRNQKTRWGSCSSKNNISLNMKLVLLPKELIDYVILHELVHTRIHNHSKKFRTELDRYTGNGKVMAKRLRMNDLRLL